MSASTLDQIEEQFHRAGFQTDYRGEGSITLSRESVPLSEATRKDLLRIQEEARREARRVLLLGIIVMLGLTVASMALLTFFHRIGQEVFWEFLRSLAMTALGVGVGTYFGRRKAEKQ